MARHDPLRPEWPYSWPNGDAFAPIDVVVQRGLRRAYPLPAGAAAHDADPRFAALLDALAQPSAAPGDEAGAPAAPPPPRP